MVIGGDSIGPVYYFDNGALGAYGTYDTVLFGSDQAATMKVSYFDPGNSGAVPEPASWAMMIFGFGLVGGAMRRKGGKRTADAYLV